MKKLLGILVLGLLIFASPSYTADIRDFQVEGMSIGDSLLDHFSEKEINSNKGKGEFKIHKFIYADIGKLKSLEIYSSLRGWLKPEDKNYKLYSVEGNIFYGNKINDCYKKQKEIVDELTELFKDENVEKFEGETKKHGLDKSGRSTYIATYFDFTSGGTVQITCTDWSKELKWPDQLSVAIDTKEYGDFLQFGAWK